MFSSDIEPLEVLILRCVRCCDIKHCYLNSFAAVMPLNMMLPMECHLPSIILFRHMIIQVIQRF